MASLFIHGAFQTAVLLSITILTSIDLLHGRQKIMVAVSRLIHKAVIGVCVASLCLLIRPGLASDAGADTQFLAVLDSAVVAERGGDYHVIDRIFELRRNSKEVNGLLVDLLDYYLGEGAGEVLQDFITREGKGIESLLTQKRAAPLNCLHNYEMICRKDVQERNRQIDYMLDAINKGVILRRAD